MMTTRQIKIVNLCATTTRTTTTTLPVILFTCFFFLFLPFATFAYSFVAKLLFIVAFALAPRISLSFLFMLCSVAAHSDFYRRKSSNLQRLFRCSMRRGRVLQESHRCCRQDEKCPSLSLSFSSNFSSYQF